jgi:cytochrome c-type biogenesis protein CcmH
MTSFLIIAALMSAIAASAVAFPLVRDRKTRLIGGIAAVAVIGAAAGLYPLWSNWDWHAPARAQSGGPDVAAMVARLEARLQSDPNDLKGWLMLGRSYLALDRLDDAVVAYDHAHRLEGGKNVEATLGLGEAISMRAGGEITPQAAQLFEDALAVEADNPKALLYAGFAAAGRGDRALARSRWEALKALHPPPQIAQMLDVRIAELGPVAGGAPLQAGGGTAAGGSGGSGSEEGQANAGAVGATGSPGESGESGAAGGGAQATVRITLAPALQARLHGPAPLFVFAREPGGHGPPLAAKRLDSSAIGSQVLLSAADSMIPGRVLKGGQRVSITARVSFSGQPTPAAGDLYGELTYDVGRDGVRDLVIDRIAE